ncbi:hypothetical protein BDDG_12357 [Blastomyces dermatitidis ATCC 18188]|uniref:Uncharacterized protein n=1 Tax=Ajellomyces dermatitidis (strain ATCC 18188 / CBS 674.68) TaxID=653446 RepID=A0A0J9EP74_AJEDA|nr:hypothetical protein BDDG_12357 [Blastomyces dermatitidis ATCC 18188]
MHQLVPELCNFVTDHFTLNAFYTKLIQSLRTTHHGWLWLERRKPHLRAYPRTTKIEGHSHPLIKTAGQRP